MMAIFCFQLDSFEYRQCKNQKPAYFQKQSGPCSRTIDTAVLVYGVENGEAFV